MNSRYLGHLPRTDPLHGYLSHDILPQMGVDPRGAEFRVFQSACSRDVYLYEERRSGTKMVGKFYPPYACRHHADAPKGQIEYNNLTFARGLGFASHPHYVVRPLGYNGWLNGLLVMEHLEGDSLGKVIDDAMFQGNARRLYQKLGGLAHFLARFHNRTAGEWPVVFTDAWGYAGRLIRSLQDKRGLPPDLAGELYWLRDRWRDVPSMWEDRAVLVHGDATPSNFLFGRGRHVMAIDFERMRWADRRFDLGRLCGELKHFFCQGTGGFAGAEPFIGHFLWEYSCHFPDRERTFAAITRNLPFYIGITLLRIARNSWISSEHRWRLIGEAVSTLRAFP